MEWHNERRKISELVPFPRNPRRLTEKQAADLKASLVKFNLAEIPVINADNTIIAGHQRLKILALLGRGKEEIDVRVPDRQLTPDEVAEYCVRSNKNTGEWDFDVLANQFELNALLDWGFLETELGMFSASDADIPAVESGDRAPFRRVTFTLHDEQYEEIEAALAKAKKDGGGESSVNENSNGNALAFICGRFNRG